MNRLRNLMSPQPVHVSNDEATRLALNRWLSKGYNRLNIGGGPKNLSGFVNLDFTHHANVEREVLANIMDLSFIDAGCIAQVHSNHVLEHLASEQIAKQLKEYHRMLQPGGRLTLRCPNALGAAYAFWFDPIRECDPARFVSLGYPVDEDFDNEQDGWLHKDFYGLLHWFYGDVGNIKNEHLSLITPTLVSDLVEQAGFDILAVTAPEALNIVLIAQKPQS